MKYRLIEYQDYGVTTYSIQKFHKDILHFINGKGTWETLTIREILKDKNECNFFKSFTELTFSNQSDAKHVYDEIVKSGTINSECIELILKQDCNINKPGVKILEEYEIQ